MTELHREGERSLLKLCVLLERDDGMAAVSDIVCLCIAQSGVCSTSLRNTKEKVVRGAGSGQLGGKGSSEGVFARDPGCGAGRGRKVSG